MAKSVEKPKVKKFRYHVKFEYLKDNIVRHDSLFLEFEKEVEDDAYFVAMKTHLSAKFVDVTIVDYKFLKTVMV